MGGGGKGWAGGKKGKKGKKKMKKKEKKRSDNTISTRRFSCKKKKRCLFHTWFPSLDTHLLVLNDLNLQMGIADSELWSGSYILELSSSYVVANLD